MLGRKHAWERSRSLLQEALGLVRSMDDRRGEICVLLDLANALVALDDRKRAELELERALDVCDDIGEKSFQAQGLVPGAAAQSGRRRARGSSAGSEAASRLWRELDDEVKVAEIARLINDLRRMHRR